MTHNIKVIFSDLFGVLIGPDYTDLINYINEVTDETEEKIYQHVFDEASMNFIRGEISFNQYFSKVQYKIKQGNQIESEKFSFFWQQMKMGQMPTADALIKIKEKYKIYIITNTTTSHIESISKKFDFINEFDGIITSDMARSHKPSGKIFNFACSLASISANDAVFIDDSKSNVVSASKLGMMTHQYTSYRDFSNFLKVL
tara:strand:+ start:257 stop:859 length:603 start_codon:yes stop_codon:yes gene_type:complete